MCLFVMMESYAPNIYIFEVIHILFGITAGLTTIFINAYLVDFATIEYRATFLTFAFMVAFSFGEFGVIYIADYT